MTIGIISDDVCASKQFRHQTEAVKVGSVTIGGGFPIVVQSMTNTETADVIRTAQQCFELWQMGSELVRVTVNTKMAAKSIPYIRDKLVDMGWAAPIMVGDFHYIGHQLLSDFPDCANALAKYRINPGNVGFGSKHDRNFSAMIEVALKYDKPIRIGVNWGSIDQDLVVELMDKNAHASTPKTTKDIIREALVLSTLMSARYAEKIGLPRNKIILSCKTSQVQDLIAVYQALAKTSNYALHLGLTEAGLGSKGVVATTSAFAILLQQGIGDTIRASLTPTPNGARSKEVIVCQEILQSLGFRNFMPMVTACPGCGRTSNTVFQELAQKVQKTILRKLPIWYKQYPGIENLKIAVMGCVVNGPGESKHADIGISLPGTGEKPSAPVFIDGKKITTLRGSNLAEEFLVIMEEYIQKKFMAKQTG